MIALLLACAEEPGVCGPGESPEETGCTLPEKDDEETEDTPVLEWTCGGLDVTLGGSVLERLCVTCEGGTCVYDVATVGEDTVDQVELDLADTAEGDWSEWHDAFVARTASEGYQAWQLTLELLNYQDEYTGNEESGTLFNLGDAGVLASTTLELTVFDAEGALLECVVYGHDPSWFAEDDCNVAP